jgi:hypothetical protein
VAHLHEDDDSYVVDQGCLIALAASFGGICLTLYFLNINMLRLMLGPQFHDFILWSGIVLITLAVIRAAILWWQRRSARIAHEAHGHEHACCGDHEHSHGHGHEHAWAPWRYAVLLVPVFLFLLGLPNKPPRARAMPVEAVVAQDTVMGYSRLVAESADPFDSMPLLIAFEHAGRPDNIKHPAFMRLLEAPYKSPELEGAWVTASGFYMPGKGGGEHAFNLANFRIICCGNDVEQVNLVVNSRQSLKKLAIPPRSCVRVTGKIEFHRPTRVVLQITDLRYIAPTDPPEDPYVN